MHLAELHKLVRKLRDLAVVSTAVDGQRPISAGQLMIVEDILAHHQATIGEITERTRLAQSFVSKTVADLKKAGVVTIRQPVEDKRRTIVRVSPAARTRMRETQGQKPIRPALQKLLPQADGTQLDQIEHLLEDLSNEIID